MLRRKLETFSTVKLGFGTEIIPIKVFFHESGRELYPDNYTKV